MRNQQILRNFVLWFRIHGHRAGRTGHGCYARSRKMRKAVSTYLDHANPIYRRLLATTGDADAELSDALQRAVFQVWWKHDGRDLKSFFWTVARLRHIDICRKIANDPKKKRCR
jgi:DNA-directed RNA polymerase specialized sigma24 family protein